MKILVIEPVNSTKFKDESIAYLEEIRDPGTEIVVKGLKSGPPTIETYVDVAQASPEIVNLMMEERNHYDAFMVNCFADPGVDAARELSDRLVLGVAETTMHMAAMLSDKFTVITTDRNSIPWTENQARMYALKEKLASVVAVDVGVDSLRSSNQTYPHLLEQARKELEKGSEAIVLGCTEMKSFAEKLQEDLGVPVFEPTKVTLKVAESLIKMKLSHSKFIRYSMTDEKNRLLNR